METGLAEARGWTRPVAALLFGGALSVAALLLLDDPLHARAAAIAACAVALWIFEPVPPFAPTLLLAVAIPIFVGPLSKEGSLSAVMKSAADPVLALFFGGFTLGAALQRHGIDRVIVARALSLSHGSPRALVLWVGGATAVLSMWMSNVAAAAVMVAALRPLARARPDALSSRALLLAVALGANLGGMATPVGSGPNAIALSAVNRVANVSFLEWCLFALPLTVFALAAGLGGLSLVAHRGGGSGAFVAPPAQEPEPAPVASPARRWVFGLAASTVAFWLTEPVHGVPASVTAMALAAALFGSRLLLPADLSRIDWGTLLLIGGGLVLGRLLESSGMLEALLGGSSLGNLPVAAQRIVFVALAALLSAVMSNTATATILIPLAQLYDPSPATPILIAVGASFGFPFTISTPPNAMVKGEGVRSSDLLWLGLPFLVFGTLVVALTGDAFLTRLFLR